MKYLFYFIFSCMILTACNSSTQEAPQQGGETTATQVIHLSAQEFKAKMDELPDEQIVDVRTPEEIAQGYIPNAKHMNIRDSNFKDNIATLDRSKPLMVYCAAGGRSKKACRKIKDMGFSAIYELDSGFGGWTQENFPVAK